MHRLFSILLIILIFFLGELPTFGHFFKKDKGSLLQVGDTLPVFTLHLNEVDSKFSFPITQQERPIVIVFFNTNCRDCQRELPELEKFYIDNKKEIKMICISRDLKGSFQTIDEVQNYWEKNQLTMPYFILSDRYVYNMFAQFGIPRIYVTDEEKIVRKIFVGKVSYKRLDRALKHIRKTT